MRNIIGSLLLLTLLATGSEAVTLRESPVRQAMQAGLAANARLGSTAAFLSGGDEFGGSVSRPAPTATGRKSVFRAALFSALIPGGGQYYLGKRKTARYFFAAEALTWIGYFSYRTYGNWRRDDYVNYAAVHANAQLEGKSDDFLDWVGFYENIRDFNNLGRTWDPDRAYLPDTPENHWEWQTDLERQTYRDLRNRSKEAYRKSDFMIGVAVVDRIVSIVAAVRSAGRMNRRIGAGDFALDEGRSLKLSVNPLSSRQQVCLTLYPGF